MQQPTSGLLVIMRRLGTEETSHHSQASGTRLEPYKHFCVLQSRPPGGRNRQSGGQGGHLQQPSSTYLVDMRGLVTEEVSLHYPASSNRLETDPVPLE